MEIASIPPDAVTVGVTRTSRILKAVGGRIVQDACHPLVEVEPDKTCIRIVHEPCLCCVRQLKVEFANRVGIVGLVCSGSVEGEGRSIDWWHA